MTKTKNSHDRTSAQRQQRRRDKLNQIAQEWGYKSWSQFETEVINENVMVSLALPVDE